MDKLGHQHHKKTGSFRKRRLKREIHDHCAGQIQVVIVKSFMPILYFEEVKLSDKDFKIPLIRFVDIS